MWKLAPLVLLLAALSPSTSAAIPKPTPAPILDTMPRITAVRLTPIQRDKPQRHRGDGISYDVKIENPTNERIETVFRVRTIMPFGNISSPVWTTYEKRSVVLPAKSTQWITFVLEEGLYNGGCRDVYFRVALEHGNMRDVSTTPTCSFTAELVKPDAGLAAPMKGKLQAGKLALFDARLVQSPTCDAPMKVEASVINRAAETADLAQVRLWKPQRSGASIGPFELRGDGQRIHTGVVTNYMDGHPGKYNLKVRDEASKDPVAAYDPDWHVTVDMECDLALQLHPPTTKYETWPDFE